MSTNTTTPTKRKKPARLKLTDTERMMLITALEFRVRGLWSMRGDDFFRKTLIELLSLLRRTRLSYVNDRQWWRDCWHKHQASLAEMRTRGSRPVPSALPSAAAAAAA